MDASDVSLLREFVNGKGSLPFRQLVERYQNLVFSTALRRLHDRGLAEEVAQDVFVFLSKKARLLVCHPNLAGWLYTTTLKKAANRMKSETRRKQREERFAEETLMAAERAAVPPEAFEHMDEALARLGAKDREALVLRFFQGLDLNEVGKSQGATAEAARKRVTRALEKLRSAFRQKGIAIPSSTAVVAVLTGSMQPAPASLVGGTLPGAVVPSAPSFINSLLNTMIIMNKKQIAVAIIAVLAVPFGIGQVIQSGSGDEPQGSEQQASAPPVAKPSDLAAPSGQPEAVQVAEKGPTALEGKWKVVGGEIGGEEGVGLLEGKIWTFTKDHLKAGIAGDPNNPEDKRFIEYDYKIVPGHEPKRMVMTLLDEAGEKVVNRAIYAIEDGELKIAYTFNPFPGVKFPFPEAFQSRKGDPHLAVIRFEPVREK